MLFKHLQGHSVPLSDSIIAPPTNYSSRQKKVPTTYHPFNGVYNKKLIALLMLFYSGQQGKLILHRDCGMPLEKLQTNKKKKLHKKTPKTIQLQKKPVETMATKKYAEITLGDKKPK